MNKFDGLIHTAGKTYDPNSGREVADADTSDDANYLSEYKTEVGRLEAEKRHLNQVIKQKEEELKPKSPLTVNKFDGLVHMKNGRVVDPADGHVVSLDDNDA